MKSWKKIALAGGLALAMTLTLAGCGAAKSMNNMNESSWGGDGSGLYSEQASQEYDSIGWDASAAPGENSSTDSIPRESKMIYTARLTMETVEFDKTVAGLEGLVTDCGGYVAVSTAVPIAGDISPCASPGRSSRISATGRGPSAS